MKIVPMGGGRRRLETGTVWEPKMGYSRAVQVGNFIWVSGCVGILADGTYAKGLAAQTNRCVERIEQALRELGASLEDVVRVRIYTTDIARWEEIASVMGAAFGATRPANTLLGVSALVDPEALVEIEADAYVTSPA